MVGAAGMPDLPLAQRRRRRRAGKFQGSGRAWQRGLLVGSGPRERGLLARPIAGAVASVQDPARWQLVQVDGKQSSACFACQPASITVAPLNTLSACNNPTVSPCVVYLDSIMHVHYLLMRPELPRHDCALMITQGCGFFSHCYPRARNVRSVRAEPSVDVLYGYTYTSCYQQTACALTLATGT